MRDGEKLIIRSEIPDSLDTVDSCYDDFVNSIETNEIQDNDDFLSRIETDEIQKAA